MKAYSLHAINDLRYEDVDYPKCPSGWCIVKVKATGICSSDIPRIFTKGTYYFPTIPGHELSGRVYEVADECYEDWIGKKVGVFPLIPCKMCEQCKDGHYEMCSNYDYIGSRRDGGFAEYVAVPIWNLVEIPEHVSFLETAMMEPLAVALHAMKLAEIKNTDDVAIVGTGMIAFAAAQWARSLGANSVTIMGRSEEKRKYVEKLSDVEYEINDNCEKNYDIVLEAVGSNDSVNKAINIAKPSGKIILMGNPESDVLLKQDTYWRILRKQLQIIGTWNSNYEMGEKCDWTEVCDALAHHRIQVEILVSHLYRQKELKEALDLMCKHKEPYCKIVIMWDEDEESNGKE